MKNLQTTTKIWLLFQLLEFKGKLNGNCKKRWSNRKFLELTKPIYCSVLVLVVFVRFTAEWVGSGRVVNRWLQLKITLSID